MIAIVLYWNTLRISNFIERHQFIINSAKIVQQRNYISYSLSFSVAQHSWYGAYVVLFMHTTWLQWYSMYSLVTYCTKYYTMHYACTLHNNKILSIRAVDVGRHSQFAAYCMWTSCIYVCASRILSCDTIAIYIEGYAPILILRVRTTLYSY